VINVIRYEEKFDPNHAQECICHRSPMSRGLEESPDGSYVDYEEYEKLKQRCAELDGKINQSYNSFIKGVELGLFYDGDNALKKFAIEQQIEALAHVLSSYKTQKFCPTNYAIQAFNDGVAHLWAHIVNCELQLRKEQDSE